MKLIKIYILFVFFLSTNFCFSQYYSTTPRKNNDIETLEKLKNMMDKDKSREMIAKQNVIAYRSEIRNEIREVISLLNEEQYKDLLRKENLYWQMATEGLKYSRNYEDFYRNNYSLLENYKNTMLDSIARIIND